MTLPLSPCPVCAADDWEPVLVATDIHHGTPGTFPLARCRACGLRSLQPPPSAETVRAAYPPAYGPHQPAEPDADDALPRAWRTLRLRPGMRVLDVGCGSGRALDRLRRLGCDAWGVEPDAAASSAARSRGLRVHAGTLEDAPFPPLHFHAIGLVHVVEHLPDPLRTLRRAALLLAPEGRLLVATPNAEAWTFAAFREAWYPLDAPRHLNLFTRGSLAGAFERAGLRRARLRTRPQPRVIQRSARRSGRRALAALLDTLPGRAAGRLASAVLGGLFGRGEELVGVARKR